MKEEYVKNPTLRLLRDIQEVKRNMHRATQVLRLHPITTLNMCFGHFYAKWITTKVEYSISLD